MGKECPVLGWSITGSAPLSSNLAAVLAGFVFLGMIFLFGREGRTRRHTLGLFCAAFVTLGFDSHLYSVVAGSASDPICARVWSEGIGASGMLGVGGMAIITGIIWLLPGPQEDLDAMEQESARNGSTNTFNLSGIVLTMAYGVSITVMLLLGSTMYNFLHVIARPHAVPTSWAYWTDGAPLIVGALAVTLAVVRSGLSRRSPQFMKLSEKALRLAAYGIMAYALAATIFSALVGELGGRWWHPPSELVVIPGVIIGIVIPGALMILLVHAKPELGSRRTTHLEIMEPVVQFHNGYRPRHTKPVVSSKDS